MKVPETRIQFATLFNLEALAAEGSGATEAERALAAHKAERLRAKLKHAKPSAGAEALNLLGWLPKEGKTARSLIVFGPDRARACEVARDVARASLGVDIGYRNRKDGKCELAARIDAESAKALSRSLEELVKKIEGFWEAYLEKDPTRIRRDGLAFFAGLADGIIGDGRPNGIVPGYSVHRKSPRKGARGKTSNSREFTLHPYEVGHTTGMMSRLDVDLPRIQAFLSSASQMLPQE